MAVVALLGVVFVSLRAESPHSESVAAEGTSPRQGAVGAEATWPWTARIPTPPLSDRQAALQTAGGDWILVVGGFVPNDLDGAEPPYRDGAVLDLSSNEWHPLEPFLPGGFAHAVWTGDEFVVSNAGVLATLDPVSRRWREVAVPDDLAAESALADTQFLAWFEGEVLMPFAGVAWDPSTDEWRRTAAAPATLSEPTADSAGGGLVVSGANLNSAQGPIGYRYDPTDDRWTAIPGPDQAVYQGDAIGVVDDELIVVSWLTMSATALDLQTSTWRELPPFPRLAVKCLSQVESAPGGIAVVAMCGQFAALAPGADHWVAFQPPDRAPSLGLIDLGHRLVANGTVLDVSSDRWIGSPELGPVAVGGVTIDRTVDPVLRSNQLGESVDVQFGVLDCNLNVRPGSDTSQRTFAAARSAAAGGAAEVDWNNRAGTYSLSCPTPATYEQAFDAIAVGGERGSPRDASAVFEPLGPQPNPDALVEAAAAVLTQRAVDAGRTPRIGGGIVGQAPPVIVLDDFYDDELTAGDTYDIRLRETDDGWIIVSAAIREICRDAPATEGGDCS